MTATNVTVRTFTAASCTPSRTVATSVVSYTIVTELVALFIDPLVFAPDA